MDKEGLKTRRKTIESNERGERRVVSEGEHIGGVRNRAGAKQKPLGKIQEEVRSGPRREARRFAKKPAAPCMCVVYFYYFGLWRPEVGEKLHCVQGCSQIYPGVKVAQRHKIGTCRLEVCGTSTALNARFVLTPPTPLPPTLPAPPVSHGVDAYGYTHFLMPLNEWNVGGHRLSSTRILCRALRRREPKLLARPRERHRAHLSVWQALLGPSLVVTRQVKALGELPRDCLRGVSIGWGLGEGCVSLRLCEACRTQHHAVGASSRVTN